MADDDESGMVVVEVKSLVVVAGEEGGLGDPVTVEIRFVPQAHLENVKWTMSYEIDHVGKHGSVVLAETGGETYAGGEEAVGTLDTPGMDLTPHKRAHLLNTGLLKLVLSDSSTDDVLVQVSMVVMVSKGPEKTLLRRILNPLA